MLFRKHNLFIISILLFSQVVFGQLFIPKFNAPEKIASISSEGEEIAPIPFEKGDKLFFVRVNPDGGQEDQKMGQEIWESVRTNGEWQVPVKVFEEANDRGNNGVIGSTKDGNRIYVFNSIQSRRRLARGIASTDRAEDGWTELEKLEIKGLKIGEGYYSFYMNASEDVLLISQPANDTTINEDLYVSTKKDGKWTEIVSLGSTINTEGYEISPYLTEDKRALYFSSNGHGGEGSADIFVSNRIGDGWTKWTKPLNLGSPLNSSSFDAYFVMGNNKEVFFASDRGGARSDIYTTKLVEENSVQLANATGVKHQFVYNGLPQKNKKFDVLDENGVVLQSITTDENGMFSFGKLKGEENYFLKLKEEDESDFPGGIVYHIDHNSNKSRKYVITEDGLFTSIDNLSSDQNVIGTFEYMNLPLKENKILVLDNSNNVVDTVVTNGRGAFRYKKINDNENYIFKPVNLYDNDAFILTLEDLGEEIKGTFTYNNLPLTNTTLLVYDEEGNVTDTIVTGDGGEFSYQKLDKDSDYTFQPYFENEDANLVLDLELSKTEESTGVFTYNKLPVANQALVVLDENGFPLDTIYTNENGEFKYYKLKGDNFTLKPLNEVKFEEEDVAFVDINNNEEIAKAVNTNTSKKESISPIKSEPAKEQSFIVYFDFNKFELDDNDKNVLEKIIKLNRSAYNEITLSGYTDNIGTLEQNKTVATNRVVAVKDYLQKNGIKLKIKEVVFGERNPVKSNNTENGRAANRRVVVELK